LSSAADAGAAPQIAGEEAERAVIPVLSAAGGGFADDYLWAG
jgi:hypothetical protein